ncbi:MAG: hypothetical protein AB7H90_22660 [Alphaproteobacteria bacterium]
MRLPSGCPPHELEEGTHENYDRLDTGRGHADRSGVLRSTAAARAAAATGAAAAADGRPRATAATAAPDDGARTAATAERAGAEASRGRPALPAGYDVLAPGGALHRQ